MARMQRLVAISFLSLMFTGCVAQEKYNALKLDRDRTAEALAAAQSQLQAAQAKADAYESQFGQLSGNITNKDALIANQNATIQDLTRERDDLMRRLQEALGRQGQTTALPGPLNSELESFAASNPDLIEFDAQRGIVKFKSDVTFAVGDAELTPKAREVITRFAAILNSPNASQYELMVCGHTDNSPVRNPNTIAKGHKDNWYLSAHRAISVANELMRQRVSPKRIGAVGYADQRPVAANVNEAGKQQNRRVEVLILPTVVRGADVQPGAPDGNAPAPEKQPALNKDNAPADPGPALNK
jgi:chemotaxis protein MotB